MEDPKIMKISTYHHEEELRRAYEAFNPIEMFGTTYKVVEIRHELGVHHVYIYILTEVKDG